MASCLFYFLTYASTVVYFPHRIGNVSYFLAFSSVNYTNDLCHVDLQLRNNHALVI